MLLASVALWTAVIPFAKLAKELSTTPLKLFKFVYTVVNEASTTSLKLLKFVYTLFKEVSTLDLKLFKFEFTVSTTNFALATLLELSPAGIDWSI